LNSINSNSIKFQNFIELTSFKSLFLLKFQDSTSDQSHHLLVKLSCKNGCKNLDVISAGSTSMFFEANVVIEEEIIVAAITLGLLIFTRF